MASEATTFEVGETVIADSEGVLYKAKVLETLTNEAGLPACLIHFVGWNKKWDSVYLNTELMKMNQESLELLRKSREAAKAAMEAQKQAAAPEAITQAVNAAKGVGHKRKTRDRGSAEVCGHRQAPWLMVYACST